MFDSTLKEYEEIINGNISSLLKTYHKRIDYCVLCENYETVINSHALQEAALSEISRRSKANANTVVSIDNIFSSFYRTTIDIANNRTDKLIKTINQANTFHNICNTCERVPYAHENKFKLGDAIFNNHELKGIALKGLLPLKDKVDQEIFLGKNLKNDTKLIKRINSLDIKPDRLYNFSKESLDSLEHLSEKLSILIDDVKNDKKQVISVWDSHNRNTILNFSFGCLTSRIIKSRNGVFIPIIVYISPHGDTTRMIILGFKDSINRLFKKFDFIKNSNDASFQAIYTLLSSHLLTGLILPSNTSIKNINFLLARSNQIFQGEKKYDINSDLTLNNILKLDKRLPLIDKMPSTKLFTQDRTETNDKP